MTEINTLCLIGIGLIGSSLARVVRQRQIAQTINISTRSAETLEEAKALDLGDYYTTDMCKAVEGADLVIVCTPVGVVGKVAQTIAGHIKPGAIVTDVGSVKQSIIDQMSPHLPHNVHFIPAHPVAGTEKSGPANGFATLFDDRWCILTPPAGSDPEAVDALTKFWEKCGSNVEIMDPKHHDIVLAITSHLPQLVAYNMVGTAEDIETVTNSEVIKFSAGGFRDSTRLAASDPTMWRDVCLHNKEAILEMIARFNEDLTALQRAIRWGDGDKLFDLFTRTRNIRRKIIEAGQEVGAPNFGRDDPSK